MSCVGADSEKLIVRSSTPLFVEEIAQLTSELIDRILTDETKQILVEGCSTKNRDYPVHEFRTSAMQNRLSPIQI